MTNRGYPRRGQVYLVGPDRSAGDTKQRPGVIISLNPRNQYAPTVLVVPITSDLSKPVNETRVLIHAHEGGLERDSVAMCDRITNLKKSLLGRSFGTLSEATLVQITQGVGVAIGVDWL